MSELSEFEKEIEKAEKELDARQAALERAKEKILKDDRKKKFKEKPLKDLSFKDLDTMKEDGIVPDGFSHPAGYAPDTSGLYSKLLDTLKQILEIRGYQVSLKPMKSLIDVRDNIFAIRDALKQQNEPSLDGLEIPVGETVDFEKWDKAYQDVLVKSDEPHVIQTHVDCTKMAPGEYCEMLDDGTWRIKKSKSKIPYTRDELLIAQAEINKMLAKGEYVEG